MAKLKNPVDFNPNVLSLKPFDTDQSAIATELSLETEIFLGRALMPESKWEERSAKIKEITSAAKEDFNTKFAKAQELLAKADPKNILGKIYSQCPIMPKVECRIHSDPVDGHGLTVENKFGGVPDLRRHWMMGYREREGSPNITVEQMVSRIWPKHPDGGYLSCYGTVDIGIHMWLLSQVTDRMSTFAARKHNIKSFCGRMAFFAPWYPGFDNRLDACVIKLDRDTHGISEDEYLQALKNLGILDGERDYHGEEGHDPMSHHLLGAPVFGFDLEAYNGDWCGDDYRVYSKKYDSAVSDIEETINDWDERENPDNSFASQYPAFCFGGKPTSQQTPKRYADVNSFPKMHLMTPFLGFSHPVEDMDYQIYTPLNSASETADTTYYGKVEASCT